MAKAKRVNLTQPLSRSGPNCHAAETGSSSTIVAVTGMHIVVDEECSTWDESKARWR